ncbi:hypothetical protein [Paenibacillus sp. ATY16]|uniref:hypothetical protein n=1 Tax=Paenibacillus sp. ATY16 TaxID=1759312 RepID=UPI00200D457F|nr:hypothetical protein [Paenibacillus sp. ATY16]MCK9861674.1 hypothetical protein [Paenibacillus sp. ATY16]
MAISPCSFVLFNAQYDSDASPVRRVTIYPFFAAVPLGEAELPRHAVITAV